LIIDLSTTSSKSLSVTTRKVCLLRDLPSPFLRVNPQTSRQILELCAVFALLASMPNVPFLLLPKLPIEIDSLYEGIDFYTSVTRARFKELC
jgi:hypothetical protein